MPWFEGSVRDFSIEPRMMKLRLSPGLNNDLYTEAFNNMHARDLYIMRCPDDNLGLGTAACDICTFCIFFF